MADTTLPVARLGLRVGFLVCLSGLPGCSRPLVAVFPRQPAYGTPETCPDVRTDVGVEGVGVDDVRCSYADALGGAVFKLSGSVRAADPNGGPGFAVEGILVSVHPYDGVPNPRNLDAALGSTKTDAQGHFHLTAIMKKPGGYLVVARAKEGADVLTYRALQIEQPDHPSLERVELTLPVDPALAR